MISKISFPGIHLGPFEIDPVLISGSFFTIRWYGAIITLGMILGVIYAAYCAKKSKISIDDLLDYVIFAVPSGIICARLYYVIFNIGEYHSFYDVIAIWNGGLAIYGGIIGGFTAIFAVSKFKKKNLAAVLDCFAPGVLIGQIFGRWGNFFNAEAYGTLDKIGFPFIGDIATPSFESDFPLRMVIENPLVGEIAVHPTFLYESVWNLCGLLLIHFLFKHKKFNGEIVLVYLSWYGFGRFFIEGMREDSLMLGSFRVSQLVAAACVIIGITLLVLGFKLKCKQTLGSEAILGGAVLPDISVSDSVNPVSDKTDTKIEDNHNNENKTKGDK